MTIRQRDGRRMRLLNKVIMMGRLGRDPEVRYLDNGTPVASVSLAVDRDFKDKTSGQRLTDWIDVVAWNATAKFLGQYFTKGRMAVVEGRLQVRSWKDKDGNQRRTTEVVAESIYFGDSRSTGEPAAGQTQPGEFRDLSEDEGGELPF